MMTLSVWTKSIIETLKELSDSEFQQRVWIKGKGPEVSSFDEAINRLFDDFDFKGFLALPEISSNLDLYPSLLKVYNALDPITDEIMSDKKIDQAFLISPLWKNIMKLSKKAKEKLDSLKIK